MLTRFAGEYANLRVIGRNQEKKWYGALYDFAQYKPNSIVISCCSSQPFASTQETYESQILKQMILDLFSLDNVL